MHAPEIAVAGTENEAKKLAPCRKIIPTPEATNHATLQLAGAGPRQSFFSSFEAEQMRS